MLFFGIEFRFRFGSGLVKNPYSGFGPVPVKFHSGRSLVKSSLPYHKKSFVHLKIEHVQTCKKRGDASIINILVEQLDFSCALINSQKINPSHL